VIRLLEHGRIVRIARRAELGFVPATIGERRNVHRYLPRSILFSRNCAKNGRPADVRNIEKVIMSSKFGRERFKFMQKRVEAMRERWL
jgi:hypothetical protein